MFNVSEASNTFPVKQENNSGTGRFRGSRSSIGSGLNCSTPLIRERLKLSCLWNVRSRGSGICSRDKSVNLEDLGSNPIESLFFRLFLSAWNKSQLGFAQWGLKLLIGWSVLIKEVSKANYSTLAQLQHLPQRQWWLTIAMTSVNW